MNSQRKPTNDPRTLAPSYQLIGEAEQMLKNAHEAHHNAIRCLMVLATMPSDCPDRAFIADIGTKTCHIYADRVRAHILSRILDDTRKCSSLEDFLAHISATILRSIDRAAVNEGHLLTILDALTAQERGQKPSQPEKKELSDASSQSSSTPLGLCEQGQAGPGREGSR
jgi:hypothetical protein